MATPKLGGRGAPGFCSRTGEARPAPRATPPAALLLEDLFEYLEEDGHIGKLAKLAPLVPICEDNGSQLGPIDRLTIGCNDVFLAEGVEDLGNESRILVKPMDDLVAVNHLEVVIAHLLEVLNDSALTACDTARQADHAHARAQIVTENGQTVEEKANLGGVMLQTHSHVKQHLKADEGEHASQVYPVAV
eukprot:CAMPEP_0170471592 /NCGR_PEP_ID=MMETSP0123-20130129/13775_1 /TAXON_ID=182087 /ORGANISM="Favella ehrenbergii, Strain Fehren 1" /LENGTH=189 /DNA_ID=CAMNT_0010739321 /DNA_START=191 /DNA_END=762 /DNA_ORIENTATION=+